MGKPNVRLFLYFLFTLFKYSELKLLRLVRSFGFYKRWTLRRLIWRRGLLFRPAIHVGIAGLALLAIAGGAVFGPLPSLAVQNTTASEVVAPPTTTQTSIPENRPRSEVIEHIVAAGETLSQVADRYNISIDTIKWANNLSSDDLTPGQKLSILPVSGVLHRVAAGETLEEVAKKHSASSQAILDFPFNDIGDDLKLKVGQVLVVPDGRPIEAPQAAQAVRPVPALTPVPRNNGVRSSSGFIWPVDMSQSYITQYASWYHMAIDIAGPIGTPIVATKSGRVVDAQNLWYGYGRYVEIDHGDGTYSLYAHMNYFIVKNGQYVNQGQVIGYRGSTGRSTGSHLHFEVRTGSGSFGERKNPLTLLP